MNKTEIKGIGIVTVYVDDFRSNFEFYKDVLGLEKSYDMSEKACFFKMNNGNGLYLEGGNKKTNLNYDTIRTSFIFNVDSVFDFYEKLKTAKVKIIHDTPEDMGNGDYWFQFSDPAGNILEVLGKK